MHTVQQFSQSNLKHSQEAHEQCQQELSSSQRDDRLTTIDMTQKSGAGALCPFPYARKLGPI